MANTPADRILAAGRMVAEIFRGGELALISLIAAFCGRGKKRPQDTIRKLKDQKTRKRFGAATKKIISGLASTAQETTLQELSRMYASTAAEIEALGNWIETDLAQTAKTAQEAVRDLLDDLNEQWLSGIKNMRRKVDDIYRQVVELEQEKSWESGQELIKAVEDVLEQFAEKGVTGFTDRANRNWGLAEYSEMAMRTAMQRANLLATMDTMLRTGQDLCYVNRHMGSCPVCMHWEATVLSLTGRTPGYMTLKRAMESGLFHPNCAHILLVYIEGISDLEAGPTKGMSKLDNHRLYLKRQQQRYLERNVRKWKKKQAAAIDPKYERYCMHQVEYWQKRIRDHIKDNPELPRRYEREGGKVVLTDLARAKTGGSEAPTKAPRDASWKRIISIPEEVKTAVDQKTNSDSPAMASVRFLNKTDRLHEFARKIVPIDGYEDIVVHGDAYGFVFRDADGNESNVSAVEFATILKESGLYNGGAIRLISCETGAEGAVSAQALADALNVEVIAPSDIAYVSENGKITIGHPLTNVGHWVKMKPKGGKKDG